MLRQEPKPGDNVVVFAVEGVFAHGRGRVDHIRGEQGDREYGVKMFDLPTGTFGMGQQPPQELGQFIRRETFMVLLPGVTLDSNAPLARRIDYGWIWALKGTD